LDTGVETMWRGPRQWGFVGGCVLSLVGAVGLAALPMLGVWTALDEGRLLGIVAGLAVTAASGAMLAVLSIRRSAR
jgi:hypothetical protein